MSFTDTQKKLLTDKLDASHVRPPQQYGPKGDYLEGWHVIAEANRIFGFDAWSYEALDVRCVSEAPRKIGKGQKDGWGVTYTAKVRVTVQEVVREDFGAGHGYDVDAGLAHESAVKEAVTDALKRALRTFGNPFGLALYDKTRANVGTAEVEPEPKKTSAAEMKRGLETITQELLDCRTPNDAQKVWKSWVEVFRTQAWPNDYIDIAKERIQARGRELKAEYEAEEVFPGDAPVTDAEFNKHPVYAG